MARLINHNQLFIHTAKTGGTFFREALNHFGIPNREIAEKHSPLSEVSRVIHDSVEPPTIKNVFGFVRNPLTWYRSRWAYAVMTNFGHKLAAFPLVHPVHNHWMAKVWSEDLNTFVENTLKFYPNGIAFEYFDKMLEIGRWKESGVDVYRYENLVYATASILSVTLARPIPIRDIVKLKPQLDSKSVGGTISPMLSKEIEVLEHKLMEMYY